MRVLMIPSFFRNNENKSSGSFFLDQAILMQEKGHDVSILFADTYSLKHIGDFFNYKEKNEIINGISIIRDRELAPFKHNGILGNRKAFIKCCLKIIKQEYNDKLPFDIIHAQNCVWAGVAAYTLSNKYNIPYIITEHSSMYELAEEKMLSKLYRYIRIGFDNASSIVCVSDKLKNSVQKYTMNKISVIGNVVDTQSYSLINRIIDKKQPFVFTTVAFLTTEERVKLKGIDLLLQGFKRFLEVNSNAILKIIGVPESIIILSKLISDMNLNGKVLIIEPLERDRIFEEYKMTNCFVLLGKYETFGLVYAEAMATGLPAIATDVGISEEIISDATGVICKERNPECVANALLHVYEKYEEYQPQQIRERITSRYSKESVGEQIEYIYQSVMHKGSNNERKKK